MTATESSAKVTKDDVIEVFKNIIDPELYIDIWTLGLIYDIDFEEDNMLYVRMTFTSPACPMGQQLVDSVKSKTEALEGIDETTVEVVFQPPWEPSEDLKMLMGIG